MRGRRLGPLARGVRGHLPRQPDVRGRAPQRTPAVPLLILLSGPISYGQAVVLGLLQGVAELFPISSLGQSVIAPRVFGWDIHQNDNYFIAFLVATHLATAIVLLFFFGRDWVRILSGMWRSLQEREIAADNPDGKLGWLIVVGTIPA